MIHENIRVLTLNEKSFVNEPESIDEVMNISNLKENEYNQLIRSSIVVYHTNNMTVFIKNAFGNEGMVVPINE